MRKLLTLLLAFMVSAPMFAQSLVKQHIKHEKVDLRQELLQQRALESAELYHLKPSTPAADLDPIGTPYSDQITAFKIGESSNAFSFIAGRDKQVSIVPEVGTNGGSVAFIYRQNIGVCGGATADNGRYRYAVSLDGGMSWDVGSQVSTDAGTPAPVGHCFGKGTLNPTYTRFSRYPNMVMFVDPAATTPDSSDLNAVYVGPVLLGTSGWDGHVRGVAAGIADFSTNPTISQEEYAHQSGDQYLPASLVERVPGEFWYVALDGNANGGDNIKVNKGTFDSATDMITWTEVTTISPDHFIFDGGTVVGIPHIAFSPDGLSGYIGHPGDLNGGQDTTISPIFYESKDGGMTWSDGEEFNLQGCQELVDSLLFFQFIDTTTNDTLPILTGKATIVFQFELTVDANGDPHYFTYVAGGQATGAASGYFFYPTVISFMFDITKDQYGDWNMLHIASQSTYDGGFGDLGGGGSDYVTSGPKPEISRSVDGNYIAYSWTDSDTTLPTYNTIPDPAGGTFLNTSPELKTRAFNVMSQKLTEVVDQTAGDANFGSRALLPRPATEILENGNNLVVPTVIMDLIPGTSTLNPISYVYINDITWDKTTDFTVDPDFCFSCQETPYTNTISDTPPACGATDGSLTLNVSGGTAPYTYSWNTSETTASITNLGPGIYTVTVADSNGCTEEIEFVLNSLGAATLATSAVMDIDCFGANNGTATVTPTGGTAPFTYMWDNNETTQTATMLPPGVSTVVATDSNGCVSTTQVTILEPTGIIVSTSAIDVRCNGDTDGEVSATATGGTGALTYSWNTGDMTQSVTGLGGGIYEVFVMDANGCEISQQVVVSEPAAISVNTSSTPAPGGTASASASGGTPNYTYDWTGPNGFTASNQSFIFNLDAGTYFVTVTDANGCMGMDSVVVAGQGDGIEDELAAGLTTMRIFPNPSNGHFTLEIELTNTDNLQIELVNMRGQAVANRYLNNVLVREEHFDLSGLASGVYFLTITTSKGSATQKVMID